MENQHRKITGYRELNQAEIDLMNEVKAMGAQFEEVLIKVKNHISEQRAAISGMSTEERSKEQQRLENAEPERFAALAKTDVQTALMYLTRAVAQPEFF